MFTHKKLTEDNLKFLILTRIKKWGKATKLMPFGNDSLWKVNPHGAIALYSHKILLEFWKYKFLSYDFVCAVDGAWSDSQGIIGEGIGGNIRDNKSSIIYVFSWPVMVSNAKNAEVEAIIHAILICAS